jgi:outer membrane scaffolding protein for murein synthesis (MipA/OmpV family)
MSRYGFNGPFVRSGAVASAQPLELEIVLRPSIYLTLLLGALGFPLARAQTPSPLQEWQYEGGIVLQHLFEPNLPDWQFTLGPSAITQPVYEGASAYRVWGAPTIDIRYKDLAFFSLGEGLGVNFLRGRYYRVGVSFGFDLGRRVPDDYANLHGLGDISVAPFVKLFGSYVVSKDFPMVIRIDVRQIFAGGANGALADLDAYMPLPGSSKTLFMFAGPSITWANHRYVQKVFGVTLEQSIASGDPIFDVHGGTHAIGLGFSGTKVLTEHWLLNTNAAISYLQGSAAHSPITETHLQRALAVSVTYNW